MATALRRVQDEIEEFTSKTVPALSGSFRAILNDLTNRAVSVPMRRQFRKLQEDTAVLLKNFEDAAANVQRLSVDAKAEHQALLKMNAELITRTIELEETIKKWQQEYEPDADPDRPSYFSNLRQAYRSLFHPSR